MTTLELQKMANEVRKGIVTAVHSAKAGHPGGSLSAADVFTYLYFEEMNIDPKNPKDPDRDRFVLSKGHTAPGYYSAMAHRGYFPVEDLVTRISWTGHFCCSWNGTGRKNGQKGLPCVHAAWRWRDSGGPGMGGFHVRRTQKAGQSGSHRGQ